MVLIIGELINSTRDQVKQALQSRNEDLIRRLARTQYEAGAEVLDLNAAESMEEELRDMEWLIAVTQDEIQDIRIAIDTADPEVMATGLEKAINKPVINSITNEEDNRPIRELAAKYDVEVIGLAMGERGIPKKIDDRVRETRDLLEKCNRMGISRDRLYVDVVAMSVAGSPGQGRYAIETIREIKDAHGVRTCIGLSNISFNLPNRSLLNRTFFALLLEAGLDAVLLDPTAKNMIGVLQATKALLGEDEHCLEYLEYIRSND
ncbi:MAG: dihydropteroate synthase [Candidatus Bipolaricaulota bacterium]